MPDYVLITRPVADAVLIAEAVRKHGLTPFIEPMLKIMPLDVRLPDLLPYQAFIFTSANGVRVASSIINERIKPVYTVGVNTAEMADQLGWSSVRPSKGGLVELQGFLAQENWTPGTKFLYLSGENVTGEINVPGYDIQRTAVYSALKVNSFSDELLLRLDKEEIKSVLFFSARTAENFVSLLREHKRTDTVSSIKALCISDSVLKSLTDLPWEDVRVSETQDRDGMMALLEKSR